MQTYGILTDEDIVLNAFNTDIKETSDLLNFKLFFIVFLMGVVPGVFVWKLKITYKPFVKEVLTRIIFTFLFLLIGLLFVGINYKQVANFIRDNRDDFSHLTPRSYLGSILFITRDYFRSENKTPITIDDDFEINNTSNRLVILVVGETARRVNFLYMDIKKIQILCWQKKV
jgi:lipid A ethanolaminephosphotransferase